MDDLDDLFPMPQAAQTKQQIVLEKEPDTTPEPESDFLNSIISETTARLSEKKQSDSDEVVELRKRIEYLENYIEKLEKTQTANPNWRNQQVTERQRAYLVHLRNKFKDNNLSFKGLKTPNLRGEAYELIKNMINQLKQIARKPNVKGCDLGPFARGFCTVCGLPQKRR